MTNRRSFRGAGIAVALTLVVSGVARADDAAEKAQLEQRVKDLESQLAEVKSSLRGGYFTANSDLEARVSELERAAGDGSMSSMFKAGMKSEGGDGAFKYQWFGLIQNDWGWYYDDADGYSDDANPGTEFRRIRLGVAGQMYGNVKWHAELDFADSDVKLADMWMELANCSFGNLRVGHMKEPFGFDQSTSDKYNQFMERNYVSDVANGRNTGFMWWGNCMEDSLLYQLGMFRETDDQGSDVGNAKDGEYNFTGRISGRPIKEDDGTTWLHVGASASYRDYADDSVGYKSKANLAQGPVMAGISGTADDGMQYGLESAFVMGQMTFLGEYAWVLPNTSGPNPDIRVWSLEGSYWLTGENTAYEKSVGGWGRTSPKHNFGDGEGLGAWQLAARYQQANYDVADVNAWTVGVNWWLNPNTRVTFDVTHADPSDPAGFDKPLNVLGLRFQIDF